MSRPTIGQDVLDRARPLLEDGASYRQAAETVGCSRSTLALHLPGFGWTQREGGEYRAFVREMERRMRRPQRSTR